MTREELETKSRLAAGSQDSRYRILDRFVMYVDEEDTSITPHLKRDGFWESWVTLALLQVVERRWYCIDVGANVGYYTVLLGDLVGPFGKVLAIEPQPEIAQVLFRNVFENRFSDRTRLWVGAVGEKWGPATLKLYGSLKGSASIYDAPGYTPTKEMVVGVVPLDSLVHDWGRVDFVKIDAEGAEWDVWNGMSHILGNNPKLTIAMEVGSKRHYNLKSFLHVIEAHNFPLRVVGYDGIVLTKSVGEILESGEELPVLWLRR